MMCTGVLLIQMFGGKNAPAIVREEQGGRSHLSVELRLLGWRIPWSRYGGRAARKGHDCRRTKFKKYGAQGVKRTAAQSSKSALNQLVSATIPPKPARSRPAFAIAIKIRYVEFA